MSDLDLSKTAMTGQFYDYRSRVDLFDAYLINVESSLATKAVKGVTTTAYVAGNMAANQFQKGGMIGRWEKNTKSTYISDLLGWYNGIFVLPISRKIPVRVHSMLFTRLLMVRWLLLLVVSICL